MRRSILILCLSLVLLLSGCGTQGGGSRGGEYSTQQSAPESPPESGGAPAAAPEPVGTGADEKAPESVTLMIYLVGSNLESDYAAGSLDIQEMLDSGFSQEDFHVLLCTGGSRTWRGFDIPSNACTVYELGGGCLTELTTLSGVNMAEEATLTEFLDYGYQNYPADGYSLVLWNHGGGSLIGYGADENYGYDVLTLPELSGAFSASRLIADGGRFEWVGFDACLMSMLELAYELTPYSRYLIASEEVESGCGWDYSCLYELSQKENFGGLAAARHIIDSYEDFFSSHFSAAPDMTLSCLDLSQTGAVVDALSTLTGAAGDDLLAGQYSAIARMRRSAKAFGAQEGSSIYDSVDLYDLALEMESKYPGPAQALQKRLRQMVVYHASNIDNAYGVAIYFPYDNKEYAQAWVDYYKTLGFSRGYASFIENFSDVLTGERLSDWDISSAAPQADGEQGVYSLQLTAEQAAHFSHGYDSIWEDLHDNGEYISWYRSSDVTLDGNGLLTSRFDGRYFSIQDASGEELPCMMMEIDRTDSYSKFAIPVLIWRDAAYTSAYFHVLIDDANPNGAILGIYESMDTDESLVPAKHAFEIQAGDIVTSFLFCRQIKFDEQGNVQPFETWERLSMRGYEMEATSGAFSLTSRPFDADGDYYCLFQVVDTQGYGYETNLVSLA